MSFHSAQTSNHILQNYTYADEATRLAATGFVAADIGKVAFQSDDLSFWILRTIAPVWADLTATVAGGDFTAVSDDTVPVNSGSQIFVDSGATVDIPNLEWTFFKAINVPAGSVNIGTAMSVSEGGQDLIIGDLISDSMSFSVNSDFADATGAEFPSFTNYGAPFVLNINTDDTQTITDNPLTFQITATVVAPDFRLLDRLTLRTGSAMTNFRVKVTDNATGIIIRCIPSKAAFDGNVPGFDLASGDNTFFFAETGTDTSNQFFLGFVPFVIAPGQVVDFEIIADSVDLLGNISGIPYAVAEAHDGPKITLVSGPDSSVENSIAYWVDTDGENLGSSSITFVTEGSEDGRLDIEPVTNAGSSLLTLSNFGGGTALQLEHDDATDESKIIGEIGPLTISTTADDLDIISAGDASLSGDNLQLTGGVTASMISASIDIESTVGSLDLRADASFAILAGSTAVSIEAEGGVASVVATSGNVLLNPQTAGFHTQISATNNLVTSPVMELLNSVTDIDFYVSDALAEGVITADPGSVCFTRDGAASSIQQLRAAASANTPWHPLVAGPTSNTSSSIPTFSGTGGDTLDDEPFLRFLTAGDSRALVVGSPNSSGFPEITIEDSSNAPQITFLYSEGSDTSFFESFATNNQFLFTSGGVEFQIDESADTFGIDGSTHADTDALFHLDAGGTNGALVEFGLGDRDPTTFRTANPGDIHYMQDGTSSAIYQHVGASANNTDWAKILTDLSGIVAPGTVTDNTMLAFDGTTGTLVQEVAGLTAISGAAGIFLTFQGDNTTADNQIKFNDSLGAEAFRITRVNDTGPTVIHNATGSLSITGDGAISITPSTASNLILNSNIRIFSDNSTLTRIRPRSPSVTGIAEICLETSAGADALRLKYDENTDTTEILGSNGTFTIENAATDADMLLTVNGTGDIILDENVFIDNSATRGKIIVRSPSASGEATLSLEINDTSEALEIKHDEVAVATDITNRLGPLLIENVATDQNMLFEVNGTGDFIFNDNLDFLIDSASTSIRMDSPSAASTTATQILMVDSSAGNAAVFRFDELNGQVELRSLDTHEMIIDSLGVLSLLGDDEVVIESLNEHIQLQAGSASGEEIISLSNNTASRISKVFVENIDPTTTINAEGGDIAIRDDDLQSRLWFKKSDTTTEDWAAVQMLLPEISVEVFNSGDLDELATAGIIQVTGSILIIFKNDITHDVVFNLNDNATLHISADWTNNGRYVYSGTGTLFSGSGSVRFRASRIDASSTGTLWNISDGTINIDASVMRDWKWGTATNQNVLIRVSSLQNIKDGLDMINCRVCDMAGFSAIMDASNTDDSFLRISGFENPIRLRLGRSRFSTTDPGSSFFRIDPGINENTIFTVVQTTIDDQGTVFDTTETATGVFTAVADASKSSVAISSVTDDSPEARFVIAASGPTIEVGQVVEHTGFITNTDYNGTFIVTSSTGYTYLVREFNSSTAVPFGSNEAGTLDSDSVEVTDAAHGLSNDEGITVNTDSAIDYDGGFEVYGVATNTFRIGAVFTVTKTGTWTNAFIDQTDPKILANITPGFNDSKYQAFGHIEENATNTGISNDNAYKQLNLPGMTGPISAFADNGSGGTTVTDTAHGLLDNQNVTITGTTSYNGLFTVFNVTTNDFDIAVAFVADDATGTWESVFISDNERFKVTDALRAEFTYTGNEPFSGFVTVNIVTSKSGSTEAYLYSVGKNGINPEQGTAYVKRDIATAANLTAYTVPVDLVTGDTVQPVIAGVDTGNNILVSNIQVEIS